MKSITAFVLILLVGREALASQAKNILLHETPLKVNLNLVAGSIVLGGEAGAPPDKICRITLSSPDLVTGEFLARSAYMNQFTLNAGRYCRTQPLEPLVTLFNNSAGTIEVPATVTLEESRYEVERGFGEPEHIGQCNRNLVETIRLDLPGGRIVSDFTEQRLETTSLAHCFN